MQIAQLKINEEKAKKSLCKTWYSKGQLAASWCMREMKTKSTIRYYYIITRRAKWID